MLLKGLTDEQRDSVTHKGNLLLTACPGSGKTRVLVYRIAHLLQTDERLNRKNKIVALTYTNVAAETILERLEKLGIANLNVWAGTIHAFCLEWIIKPYMSYCPRVSKGYRIIDENEQRKLKAEIKRVHGFPLFDDLITTLDRGSKIRATLATEMYAAVRGYHEILEKNHWIDFDLILSISRDLIESIPNISRRLSDLFTYVLIDEYQDISKTQYDILCPIFSTNKTTITLIGDVDQAIYTGLGAVVKRRHEIISEFSMAELTEKTLSGCYRSTQSVIDFYSKFQDHSIDIESLSDLPQNQSAVTYHDDIDRAGLGKFVGELVDKRLAEGIDPNKIVILAPQWTDLFKLGDSLRIASPHLEFNAPHISPIPRTHDNPWIHLVRLYLTPIQPKTYSKRRRIGSTLISQLSEFGLSLDEFDEPIRKVLKATNQLNPALDSLIGDFLHHLITGFATILKIDLTNYSRLLEAKQGLINATNLRIKQYNLTNNAADIASYFGPQGGIDVRTCHSTKGEEYDVVIATGLVKGKIPHWSDIIGRSEQHTDYMARRLLYVICSRAKRYLHLISERGHKTQSGIPLVPTKQLQNVME